MCNFFSCIVMKDKTVLWTLGLNGHHEILEKYSIKDDTDDSSKMKFARVEIIPPLNGNRVFENDLSLWNFKIDQRIMPEWFSPGHRDAATAALTECLNSFIIDGKILDVVEDRRGLFIRNSTINMLKNSTVSEMWGNSTVSQMRGNSTVSQMWGNSTVSEMWENSTVCIYSKTVKFKIMSSVAVAVCRFLGKLVIKTMGDI